MDNIGSLPLENSIKYLRFQRIWPKNKEELYNGRMFYIKYILVAFSSSLLLWGSLAHLIMAVYENSGAKIDLDISIVISIISTYYFNFSYLANIKMIIPALNDLFNFKIYGKPRGISNFNKKLNSFAKWHQIYICNVMLSLCIAQLLELKRCKANNVEKGIHDVCGLVSNVWFPFDVDYFPVKQIIYLIQMYSTYFSYATSSTISFSIVESMEHVIFRMADVKILFVEAINENSDTLRRTLLRRCVDYHNFVLKTAQTLSESYSSCVFVHVLLTGTILGCTGYQLLQGPHLNLIAICIGWFLSLLMVAIVGQRLIDECSIFNNAIYDTKWYDLEVATQKDLLLVLLRSNKLIYIKAGPFGFMSHQLVLSILKTSYSIVSVMKGTS